jgi:hypothetical protein
MANDIEVTPGSGKTVATLDVGGKQHQKVLAEFSDGAGGATLVSASTPMPVTNQPSTNNIGDVDVLTLPADPLGANADAIVAAGAAGSISAKLRRITQALEDLKSAIVIGAGTNNIGDVDVLTLPADPLGANADAIVAAGAAGSLSAKLRRLTQGVEDLKSFIVLGAGNNNIGDVDVATLPADPLGANADAIVAAGAAGSISAKLRRITQALEDLKTNIVLAAGTANIGDVDVLTVPADPFGANADAAVAAGASGSLSAKLRRLTQGVEDLKTAIVLAAGTNHVGEVAAVGDVAHDTADSGNPVKVGGKGVAHGAMPAAVTANDRVNFNADVHGTQFVIGGAPKVTTKEYSTTAAQTNTSMHAPASGKKLICTRVDVSTGANTPNIVGFRVGFGASATPTTTGVLNSHAGMVAGGGSYKGDGSGKLGEGAADDNLFITNDAPGTNGELRCVFTVIEVDA